MNENHPKSPVLGTLSPAKLFVSGIVMGVLVLCTIGFFILLAIFLKGGALTEVAEAGTGNNPSLVAPSGAAAVPTQPTEIKVRAIDEKVDHVLGNAKKAKITLVEYSDLECPFCGKFHPSLKQVKEEYGDDVAWAYRHFPLESIHPNARKMANATECAGEQGKFWEMTDKIFEYGNGAGSESALNGFASELGLNTSQFSSCLSSNKYNGKVSADLASAAEAGCKGTPCTIILDEDGNPTPLAGGALTFSQLKSVLDPLVK